MPKKVSPIRDELDKVSVGFDSFRDKLESYTEEARGYWYPPYNIRKLGDDYAIDIDIRQYNKDNVNASLEGGALIVSADAPSDTSSDTFVHQGIPPKGGFKAKFFVADHLEISTAEFVDGIITFKFSFKSEEFVSKVVPIKNLTPDEETEPFVPRFDSRGRMVGRIKKAIKAEEKVVVHDDTARKPTAEVTLPDVVPPIVEVSAKKLVEKVDKKDEKPQVKVEVTDATDKPAKEDTVTKVLKTKPGEPDVLVNIPAEDYKETKKEGVDVVEVVKAAMEKKGVKAEEKAAPEVAEEPAKVEEKVETPKESIVLDGDKTDKPTVEVKVPEAIPQIVEAKVEKVEEVVDKASEHPQVVIAVEDAKHEVSDDVELHPVKTEEGKSDVVVAVKPEDKEAAAKADVDIVEKVKEAVEAAVSPAPELPEVKDETTEVKDVEGKDAKVEVPAEVPQVVEVSVEKDEADKPVVKLTDASEDVKEDAEIVPIVTAEGEHDIVAVVPPEVKEELDKAGVDVAADVGKALVDAETKVVEADVAPADVDAEPAEPAKEESEVKVELPENVPQVLAVDEVKVEDDGSVTVKTSDATIEVTDTAELSVAKTEEGKSDIIVAAEPEVKAAAEKIGVDLEKAVADAVADENKTPDIPVASEEEVKVLVDKTDEHLPTVEVAVPETTTQVVKAVIDEENTTDEKPAIKLEDTSEDVSETAELIPVLTPAGQPDMVVAVEPEVREKLDDAGANVEIAVEKAVNQADVAVETVTEVDQDAVKEASEVPEVVEKLEEIAKEPATLVVDEKAEDKPTVEVTLSAEEAPQVVTVEKVEAEKEGAVAIEVKDSSIEVSDTAELSTIATEEGKSDVVVAMEPETKAELEADGVKVDEVVKAALETNDAVPELPVTPTADVTEDVAVLVDKTAEDKPTVEVTMPDTVTQVMELKAETEPTTEEVAVKLEDTSGAISDTAELIPVVTPEGQPDIIVAVEPEVKDALESAGANTEEVVEKAVNQADVDVETVVTVDQDKIDEASEVPEVKDKLDEIAKEPATILVNDAVEDKPTVEVTLAAEGSPQIVEVKKDEMATTEDIPAITVEDATHEVSDGVETMVIETPEGKSDVVVAIDPELKTELDDKGVDVKEAVSEALETNDAVPILPELKEDEKVELTITDENEEPKVDIVVPETISQVVEAKVIDDTAETPMVELTDTSEKIDPEAEVVPVVTAEGQDDVMVVVPPETKEVLDKAEVDVATDVSEALVEANVAVEPVKS